MLPEWYDWRESDEMESYLGRVILDSYVQVTFKPRPNHTQTTPKPRLNHDHFPQMTTPKILTLLIFLWTNMRELCFYGTLFNFVKIRNILESYHQFSFFSRLWKWGELATSVMTYPVQYTPILKYTIHAIFIDLSSNSFFSAVNYKEHYYLMNIYYKWLQWVIIYNYDCLYYCTYCLPNKTMHLNPKQWEKLTSKIRSNNIDVIISNTNNQRLS